MKAVENPAGAVGGQHVVGAGHVIAEGGTSLFAGKHAASGAEQPRPGLIAQLEVFGRDQVDQLDRVRGEGASTGARWQSLDGRVVRRNGVDLGFQALDHTWFGGYRDQRALPPVLGLGTEIDAAQCRLVARSPPDAVRSDGPASESIATSPNTSRFTAWTRALPGPAITSTGRIVSVPRASAKIAWAPPTAISSTSQSAAAARGRRINRTVRPGRGDQHHPVHPATRAVTQPLTTVRGWDARRPGHRCPRPRPEPRRP